MPRLECLTCGLIGSKVWKNEYNDGMCPCGQQLATGKWTRRASRAGDLPDFYNDLRTDTPEPISQSQPPEIVPPIKPRRRLVPTPSGHTWDED